MYSPFLGDATSVLLVIPGRELTDLVAEAVQGSPVPYRVFWVSQLDLAAVRARDVSPQIILIDAGPGADEVLPLIAELGRSVPQAKLLLLATPDAMAVVQPAILAGAAGFVTLPLDAADLLASLRRVTVRRGVAEVGALAAPSAGHVIALCAPKGGTGRTTLAINTAICLRQITREPVVLVDADFAAPAIDVALNLRGERTIVDLLPRIGQLDRDLVESILAVHPTGLKLLLAPPPANLKAPVSAPHMQQIVAVLRRAYRSVLVDVGLPIDETALALLDMADRVILSVIPEMVGVRNARTMIDQFRRHGLDEDRVWLVLNQADLPGGIMARDAEERLGVHARQFLPRDQALATATVNQGVPFVLLRPHSPFARGCLDLAQKLVKSWPAAPEPGLSPAAAHSAVPTAVAASESASLPPAGQELWPPAAGAEAALPRPAREGLIDPAALAKGGVAATLASQSSSPAAAVPPAAAEPVPSPAGAPVEPFIPPAAGDSEASPDGAPDGPFVPPSAGLHAPSPAEQGEISPAVPDEPSRPEQAMILPAEPVSGPAAPDTAALPPLMAEEWAEGGKADEANAEAAASQAALTEGEFAAAARQQPVGDLLAVTGPASEASPPDPAEPEPAMAPAPATDAEGEPVAAALARSDVPPTVPAGRTRRIRIAGAIAALLLAARGALARVVAGPNAAGTPRHGGLRSQALVALAALALLGVILAGALTGAFHLAGGRPPGGSPAVPALAAVTPTPAPAQVRLEAAPAAAPATPVASPLLAPDATLAPAAAATSQATATSKATSRPADTATPAPSPTPLRTATKPAPTATPRPAAAAVAPPRSPTPPPATQPPVRPATAAAGAPILLSAPALIGPPDGTTQIGTVTFAWLATGPLPPGTAYEVVWWNIGENPDLARGLVPPQRETSLTANLGTLAATGQLQGNQLNWTVLIVQVSPYRRLFQPAAAGVHTFFYRPS